MYKKGKKLCSTPVNVNSDNTSLSLSDIKHSSSDNTSLASAIRRKRLERANVNRKKRKRKRKLEKYKNLVRKIRRRKWVESSTSDTEWEVEYSQDNNRDDKYEEIRQQPSLFQSPERPRDLGVEKDYVLSPSLIGPREINLGGIDDEVVDMEEEEKAMLPLDDNKIEIDSSSPIFERSKVVKTYPLMKKNKWRERLLRNKGSEDWLIDVKIPTDSADLLWENFIKDHSVELPQLQINDIRKDDPRDERNDEDNDTDIDHTLAILNEEGRPSLKCNNLCKIKEHCDRSNRKYPVEIHHYVKVNDQWEKDKFPKNISDTDSDIRDEKDKLMSFNEFHARSKMKRNENTDCLSQSSSKVKIKSIKRLNIAVYKRLDGNFGITKD